MKIIKANETHIPEILEIYAKARKFMKENGKMCIRDRSLE